MPTVYPVGAVAGGTPGGYGCTMAPSPWCAWCSEWIAVAVVTRGGVVFHAVCFRRWRDVLMRYGGPEDEARGLEGRGRPRVPPW